MRVVIEGADEALAVLKRLGDRADQATSAALFTEAERIMTKSRPEVPVDLGTLRGSGHVSLPQRTRRGMEVTFGYGGAAQAYARKQHEHAEYHHAVGKSHFLRDPTLASAAGMGSRLAATLRRFIK